MNNIKDDALLLKWLEEQENRINAIEEIVSHITQDDMRAMRRRPHRCPLCEGNSFSVGELSCKGCHDTGIVWG